MGMCGPLVMSLPFLGKKDRPILNMLIYNTGRIATYLVFGMVFHFFGRQLYLAGLQKGLTIIMGVFLLGFALYQWIPKKFNSINKPFAWIHKAFLQLSKKSSRTSLFLMGMLNGCLPCGMVYLAVASSLVFQPMLHGTIYMLCFGIGTLPLLIGTGYLGLNIKHSTRQYLLKIVPIYTFVLGVVLILRGMELGIPLLSPILPQQLNDFIHCL